MGKAQPTEMESIFIDAIRCADDAGNGEFKISDQKAVEMLANYRASILDGGIKKGMTRGIAWAMGFIGGSAHAMPTIAADMARNAGIRDIKELREAGVDDFDIEQIGDILPEDAGAKNTEQTLQPDNAPSAVTG